MSALSDVAARIEAHLLATEADAVLIEDVVQGFGPDAMEALVEIRASYEGRGLTLHVQDAHVSIRTAPSASGLVRKVLDHLHRNPSSAVVDTVAIVALYGPMTRSEIESVRGVKLSPGVLEKAIEMGAVAPGPRRDTPGRPMTWTTTDRVHGIFSIDRETLADFDAARRPDEGVVEP